MKARKHHTRTAEAVVASPPPRAPLVRAGDDSPLTRLDGWLMAGLTLVALALRIWRVGMPCFWGDEIHTYLRSAQPLLAILKNEWADPGQFPPLHYVLTHWGMQFFGANEFGARLPTVIFATAMVPFQYLIARLIIGRRAAVLAAIVLTLSLYHIYYSRDNHSYGIYGFFASVSFYCFLRLLLRERQHWGYWTGYTLSTGLMMLTHYIGTVAILTEAVIGGLYFLDMTLRRGRWPETGRMIGWYLLAGAGALLMLAPYLPHMLSVSKGVPGSEVDTIHLLDPKFLSFTFSLQGFGTGWPMALYVAILLAGCVYGVWRYRGSAALLLVWLLFPYLFFATVKFGFFFHVRRVIFTLPALTLLWALGLEALIVLGRRWAAERWWGYAPLAAVVVLWSLRMGPAYRDFYSMRSDDLTMYKPVAEWIRDELPEHTIVLAENYYDLRWVGSWGFYRVPDCTFCYAAIYNTPAEFKALNMRQRFQDFLTKYPEAAFMYTSIWANELGLWDWPRSHFGHYQAFENTGGEKLARMGMFHIETYTQWGATNRLGTWVVFYNTDADLAAQARAAGRTVFRRLNGGFESVLTRDLHMWLAVAKDAVVTIHQLAPRPGDVRIACAGVALHAERLELVDPAGKVITQWPLANGQLHRYEAVVPGVPPGKFNLKLRLVGGAPLAAREPPLFLIDTITLD